jgi:hypothetical protein
MRTRLTIGLGLLLVLASLPGRADAQPRPKPTRYRVIFNSDGHSTFKDARGNMDHWLENLFGPLENSHVDALFWCDGAGGNTANYQSEILELTGHRIGKVIPHLQEMLDKGHDPPEIVVREAHKRKLDVFFSFRFNDVHDRFLPEELPVFKVEHPEWLIGERDYGTTMSGKTSLNFAVPEVRELKFRIAEEVMTKYDFDGIEIDFLRSPPYFLPGQVQSHSYLLTEYLQRLRKLLDRLGRERGRTLRLAVRVDENLEACGKDGFAVKDWIDQSLVDYLILGSGVIDIDLDAFRRLARRSRTLVYPCLYGWPSRYNPIPESLARGLALNYHRQGGDGIYLFNWFPHVHNNSESNGPYLTSLLKQVGHPLTAIVGDGLMFVAERGRQDFSYPNNWLHARLPATLKANRPLQLEVQVGAVRAELAHFSVLSLRIEAEGMLAGDLLQVLLNGRLVPVDPIIGSPTGRANRISHKILRHGSNRISLTFQPADGAERTLKIHAVEIHAQK